MIKNIEDFNLSAVIKDEKIKLPEDLNKLDNPKREYLEKVFLEDANSRR